MGYQTIDLVPDVTEFNGAGAVPGFDLAGGGSPSVVLSDGSDTSVIGKAMVPGSGSPVAICGVYFQDPVLPAGSRVLWVQPTLRAGGSPGGSQPSVQVYIEDTATEVGAPFYSNPNYLLETLYAAPLDGTIRDKVGSQRGRNPNGNVDWDAAALDRLGSHLQALDIYGGGGDISIAKYTMRVGYQRQGAVTFDPSFTGDERTAEPTIKWAPSAPDQPDNPQAAYALRVFTQAVYGAHSIDQMNDPAVIAQALYDSGVVYDGGARSHKVTAPLPSAQQLIAIVYVSQPWGGTDQGGWWSWIAGAFTIHLEPLAAPDLQATGLAVDGSVRLQIQGAYNMLDQYSSGFEYPATAGVWAVESNLDYSVPVNSAGGAYPMDEWEVKITNGALASRLIRGPMLTGHGGVSGFGTIAMTVWAHGAPCNVKMGLRFFKADLTQTGPDYWAPAVTALAAEVVTRYSLGFAPAPGDTVYASVLIEIQPGSTTGAWFRVRELRMPALSGWTPTANCKTFCIVKPSLWNPASPVTPIYGDLALLVSAAAAGNLTMAGVLPPAAVAGQEYTSQAAFSRVRGAVARQVQMAMSFLNAGAGFLAGGGLAASIAEGAEGAWVEPKATYVSPAGTAYVLASPQIIAAGVDEQHLVDGIAIYPGHLGRYGAGGWAIGSTFGYEIIRSTDGGATEENVVAAELAVIDARTQLVTIYDRAAPLGRVVQYQARATATNASLGTNTSAYCVRQQAVIGVKSAWLKCPTLPFFDMPIELLLPFAPKLHPAVAIFDDIIGLDEPLIARDGYRGYRGDAVIQVDGDAAWGNLQGMLYGGETLLLQDTVGEQFYVVPTGDISVERLLAVPPEGSLYPIRKLFQVTVPFTTVSPPA